MLTEFIFTQANRIDELESKLSKNSTNSSKPPSTDGFKKVLKTKSNRVSSGKKPGGQKGHKGSTLSQVAKPDHVIVHPVNSCVDCGHSLETTKTFAIEKRQVFDLPPLKLIVTEHCVEKKYCTCGCLNTATFPSDVVAPTQYGPWVQSLVVYLSTYQFIPFARLKEFFSELFNVQLSPATMKRILSVADLKMHSTVENIKNEIVNAPLAHFDETGIRIDKTLQWLHTHSTSTLTYLAISAYRGAKAMTEIGILPKFTGMAIHDSWAPYYTFEDCIHFLCNAHHLRELQFIFEQYEEVWADKMKKLLLSIHKKVFEFKNENKTKLTKTLLTQFEQEYDALIQEGLAYHSQLEELQQTGSRGRSKQRKGKNLLDRMDTKRDQILGFMRDFNIPFTNNLAERDIRMQKLKEKISGCFRTLHGAKVFTCLRSYISTARKQNHSSLKAIYSALINQPVKLA